MSTKPKQPTQRQRDVSFLKSQKWKKRGRYWFHPKDKNYIDAHTVTEALSYVNYEEEVNVSNAPVTPKVKIKNMTVRDHAMLILELDSMIQQVQSIHSTVAVSVDAQNGLTKAEWDRRYREHLEIAHRDLCRLSTRAMDVAQNLEKLK